MEVIHLYLKAGIDYYLPKMFRPALKVVVKNNRNIMKLIQLFLKSGKKHCFLKVVIQNYRKFLELIHLYLKGGKDYFQKAMKNVRNFVEFIHRYL